MMDAKRIEEKRNGVIPCIIHSNYHLTELVSKRSISQNFIDRMYSQVFLTPLGKIFILSLTITAAIFGGLGSYQLEQWFDPLWFLPRGTYLSDYVEMQAKEFPDRGQPAHVFFSEIDIPVNFIKIINLVENLKNLSYIESVKSWPHDFAEFVDIYYAEGIY